MSASQIEILKLEEKSLLFMRGCEMNKKEPQKTISLNILLVEKSKRKQALLLY
jgi:hypothetical protein